MKNHLAPPHVGRDALMETVYSPADGVVFFRYDDPLVYAYTSAFMILRD